MIYFKKILKSFMVYYIKGIYLALYFSMIGYEGMIVLVFCMGTVWEYRVIYYSKIGFG